MDSIRKSELETEILNVLEPWLGEMGFAIVDLDARNSGHGLLRLFIEKSDGQTPTLDECAGVSRGISDRIESYPWFKTAFDLEVSSPGLERRLRKGSDFGRVTGGLVKMELAVPRQNGGKKVTGKIVSTTETGLSLEVDGIIEEFQFQSILKAHTVWRSEWLQS